MSEIGLDLKSGIYIFVNKSQYSPLCYPNGTKDFLQSSLEILKTSVNLQIEHDNNGYLPPKLVNPKYF